MLKRVSFSHFYFWLLLIVAFLLTGLGVGLAGWNYAQGWAQILWHVCQRGLENLGQHLSLMAQLALLAGLAVVALRGSWSLLRQVQQTRRFRRLFSPLQGTPPLRLQRLLQAHREWSNPMLSR